MPFLSCHVATPCLSPLLCPFPQHKGLREVMPGPPLPTRSCQGYPVDVFKKLDNYCNIQQYYEQFVDVFIIIVTIIWINCVHNFRCGAGGLQFHGMGFSG